MLKTYFKGLGQLIVIGLDIFRFIVAAPLFFLLSRAMHRTALHGLILMAGFCLKEKRHILQFALAIVLIHYKAGRADEEEKGQDDMCGFGNQISRFVTKIQIKPLRCFMKFWGLL